MKKLTYIILGIWSVIVGFLSPVWLTLTVLNFTGRIYQYDSSMDEGIALILGLIMLSVWILIALLPCILFLRKMNLLGRRPLAWCSSVMVASLLLGIAMQILRLPEIL